VVELHNTDLILEARHEHDRLFVALNLGDASVSCTIPAMAERVAGELAVHRKGNATEIVVPAHGWGILAASSQ
jgi:hypothetical protein